MGLIKDIFKLIVTIIKTGFKILLWSFKQILKGLDISKLFIKEVNTGRKTFNGFEKRMKQRHIQYDEEVL